MPRISSLLTRCRETFYNISQDSDLAAALDGFGYGSTEIAIGKGLYDSVKALIDQQSDLQGKVKQSSADYKLARKNFKKIYSSQIKVARIAFKGNEHAYKELMLSGIRDSILDKWEKQCNAFYHGMTTKTAYQTAFNRYIPQTEITAAAADFSHVLDLHATYLKDDSDAQTVTDQRNTELHNLEKWMSDFQAIAKVALKDSPQQLEKLGIKG